MKKFKFKKEISLETKILNAKNEIIRDNEKALKLAKFIKNSNAYNPIYDGIHFNDGTNFSMLFPVNIFYYSMLNNAFYDYIKKSDTKTVKIKKIAKAILCAPLMAVGAVGAIVLEIGLYAYEAINAIFKAPKFLVKKLAYKRLQNAKSKINTLKEKMNKNAYFIECNEKEAFTNSNKNINENLKRTNWQTLIERVNKIKQSTNTAIQPYKPNLPETICEL